MLYTRKGDGGESGLFGSKVRLPKDSLIYEALGTLDELNSLLGLCRANAYNGGANLLPTISGEVLPELLEAQQCLFIIQAELSGAEKSISQTQVDSIEKTIDDIERMIPPPHGFVVPGSTATAAWCDYARTVSRRAERMVIAACKEKVLSSTTMAYLNRLSSLLYGLARYSASLEQARELSPSYNDNLDN